MPRINTNIGINAGIGGIARSGASWSAYWATLISATVEDAAPADVVLTFPTAKTSLVASDFTIAGKTISGAVWVGSVLTLTVSVAFVYGDTPVVTFVKTGETANVTNNIVGIGFKTEWVVSGDSAARTITLPLVNTRTEGALAYNCDVDWGDGSAHSTVTAYNDAARAHTYAANGTYQVNITGTMEGWSFNNGGDKLKITKVINWGTAGVFNGFKYLYSAFYGCINLTSLGTGKILASGTGVLTQGFAQFCFNCNTLTAIPAGLFDNHTAITTTAFQSAFNHCIVLASIPADLFKYNTLATTYAFNMCFFQCYSITTVPADLFRYNTAVTIWGFNQTFRECSSIVTLPDDLFRYNTTCTTYAFRDTFQGCSSLSAIPQDIFRYNINVSTHSFEGTFITCTSLTTLPTDLFRYNTLNDNFFVTFQGCSNLQTLCPDLFRYNLLVTTDGFEGTFKDCVKLQLRSDIFGPDLTTRFLYAGVSDFTEFINRSSFSGTQGTAPALWSAVFPEVWEVNVRPSVAWVAGDIITGQTSGVTGTFCAWYGSWKILLKDVTGNYALDEIIGVTGVPTKLANQGAAYPVETSPLISTDCFNGAGNSLTSISNYGDIPVGWL